VDQAVLGEVKFARDPIGANLMRLEDGAQPVVFGLRDWIGAMVVTLRAANRPPRKAWPVCLTVSSAIVRD